MKTLLHYPTAISSTWSYDCESFPFKSQDQVRQEKWKKRKREKVKVKRGGGSITFKPQNYVMYLENFAFCQGCH